MTKPDFTDSELQVIQVALETASASQIVIQVRTALQKLALHSAERAEKEKADAPKDRSP